MYKVEKIPVITPLLHWYLNHGVRMTKIWGYIPANPKSIYKNFDYWVANERRRGKADKAFEAKAESAKLIGNSAYENTILNKEKIQSTKICNETEFKKHIYNPFLKDFQEYGETIELSFNPKCITENVPIQVGFAVLQYANFRMLKFYYD